MPDTYTLTIWQVKPGQEQAFEDRWAEWVEWSRLQGLGVGARLLRDHERPSTYVSFGPWASLDSVRQWRSAEGYHERVANLHDVVESFEPRTLELARES